MHVTLFNSNDYNKQLWFPAPASVGPAINNQKRRHQGTRTSNATRIGSVCLGDIANRPVMATSVRDCGGNNDLACSNVWPHQQRAKKGARADHTARADATVLTRPTGREWRAYSARCAGQCLRATASGFRGQLMLALRLACQSVSKGSFRSAPHELLAGYCGARHRFASTDAFGALRPLEPKRVVVTGLGLVTPLGVGVHRSWNRLVEGKTAVRRILENDLPKVGGSCVFAIGCRMTDRNGFLERWRNDQF